MPRDTPWPKPPEDKNRTLKWLANIGTPGFCKLRWHIETTKQEMTVHSRNDCSAIFPGTVLATTPLRHPTDPLLEPFDRCATCGYGFLTDDQPDNVDGTTTQNIDNQAERLHDVYDCAAGAAELLRMLNGVAIGTDNCPALQNVLLHNMCGRMRNQIAYIDACTPLKHAETALLAMIDKLEAENPLDLEQAFAEISLSAVRRLIVSPIAADLQHRRIPTGGAIQRILTTWDSNICNLDDAKTASRRLRASSEYRALRKKLPELTDIVSFWEKTFNSQAQRRERKIFVVTNLINDFTIKAFVNDYDALLATSLLVRNDSNGLGELPELVVEWMVMVGELNLAVTGNSGRETGVSPIDFDPRLLSEEDLKIAFSLWLEAQADTESPYVDATIACKAAKQL